MKQTWKTLNKQTIDERGLSIVLKCRSCIHDDQFLPCMSELSRLVSLKHENDISHRMQTWQVFESIHHLSSLVDIIASTTSLSSSLTSSWLCVYIIKFRNFPKILIFGLKMYVQWQANVNNTHAINTFDLGIIYADVHVIIIIISAFV